MIAEDGVWRRAAAVLAVAAACWPAASAAGEPPSGLCKEQGCDPDDYMVKVEDVLENITDLLGFNFSDIAHGKDPLNNLLDLLETRVGLNTNYRRIPFLCSQHYKTLPVYRTTKPFEPRDMTFVPSSGEGIFYDAAPYLMDTMAPQQKPEFVQHETFNVTQFNVKVNFGGFSGLFPFLSGPVTFVILLLTTAVLMIAACLTATKRHSRPIREWRPFDRKTDFHLKCCLAITLLTTLILYMYAFN